MNNPINLAIGVAILCCSSCCSSSLMNSGLGGLFSGQGGLVDGLLGLPGSVATGVLGLDKDDDGFEGGFVRGITDPVGSSVAVVKLAQGDTNFGNTIKEVDPDSEIGRWWTGVKVARCEECTVQGWPADCKSQGWSPETCAKYLENKK